MDPTQTNETAQTNNDVAEGASGSGPISGDLVNFVRGFCMGAADTVPGVSGGTVALVLGHYKRLLAAISHFDAAALAMLTSGRFSDLWRHCDLRFILALGLGLVVGAGSLASTMHWLLENRMPETFAVFFGLVLASGWIVSRWIRRWSPAAVLMLAAGAVFAFWLSGLSTGESAQRGIYLFLAASVAICAMILPGISGAFVLLLLGMYHPVMGMIRQFVHLDLSFELLTGLCLFAAGCVTGLAVFSRLLRWLLHVHPDVTMAGLLGLMLGSLRRVWPLQRVTEATADLPFKEQQFSLLSPAEWDGGWGILLALAVGAATAVLVIERVAAKASSEESPAA
jgi:putative membrane protein